MSREAPSRGKPSEREARIVTLLKLLEMEPSMNNKTSGKSRFQLHDALFRSIVSHGRDLVRTCLVILEDGLDSTKQPQREALQDELLKCLLLLNKVIQRQAKWHSKTNLKQRLHSRKYKRELRAFQQQVQECKSSIRDADFNPLGNKNTTFKDHILLSPPVGVASKPLIGRDKQILAQLHEKIPGTTWRQTNMVALVGGAGMGKTHVAGHFAKLWMENQKGGTNRRRAMFWLAAESEDSLRDGYMQILNKEPTTQSNSTSALQLARKVWDKLECLSALDIEWLVVIDHVPEAQNGLEGPGSFLPLFFPTWAIKDTFAPLRGHILLTTRSTEFHEQSCLGDISTIAVDPILENDAIELLAANKACNQAVAKELVSKYGGRAENVFLPLAVATVADDLVRLRSSEMLRDNSTNDLRETGVVTNKKVVNTIMDSLANVLKHLCMEGLDDVLRVISSCSTPDDLTILTRQGATRGDHHICTDDDRLMALERLCRLGLVRWDEKRMVYNIYQEYQQPIQLYLEKQDTNTSRATSTTNKKKAVRFAPNLIISSRVTKIPRFVLVGDRNKICDTQDKCKTKTEEGASDPVNRTKKSNKKTSRPAAKVFPRVPHLA